MVQTARNSWAPEISADGYPTKENQKIDRMNKIIYPPYDLMLNLDFHFFVFLAVILVPELFEKLRETPGTNFHQVSSKSRPRESELWQQKLKVVTTMELMTIKV